MKRYILRTCNSDMTSHGGFVWPESGPVEAPDWNPRHVCGGGLHGLLDGCGNGSLLDWSKGARWLVAEVDMEDVVDLGGKVKFPRATVVHVGDQVSAIRYLQDHGCSGPIAGGLVTGGHYSTVTGGHRSTVTGGHRSTVTGGDGSTVTGVDYSTATGGDYSTVTGGDYSTVTGGHRSMATGGDYSTVTGGDYSTVTGGDGSILQVKWFDGMRCRMATAYVGEDGIEPNVPYRLDDFGKFVKA